MGIRLALNKLLLAGLLLLLFNRLYAQPTSDTAAHIRYGASVPGSCNHNTGDVFYKTTATVTMYMCDITNHFVAMAGGGGTCASLAGDVTGTCAANTVVKVNGIAVSGTPSAGYALLATSSSAATWQAISQANAKVTFSSAASTTMTLTGVADRAVVACWDTSGSPTREFLPDHVDVTDANTLTIYFIPNATGYCTGSTGVGATGATGATGPTGPAGGVVSVFGVNGTITSLPDPVFTGTATIGPTVTAATELALTDSVAVGTSAYGVSVWGRYAVAGVFVDPHTRIVFVDLSKITDLTSVSSVDLGSADYPLNPWMFGQYLYWPTGASDTFETYVAKNIHSPTLFNSLSLPMGHAPFNCSIAGSLLYCTGNGGFLDIYDLTNRAAPALLSSFDLGSAATGIVVRGAYAYTGNRIVDVSNPSSPSGTATFTPVGPFAVSGRWLYMGQYTTGDAADCIATPEAKCPLLVYDVSDPTSPVFVKGFGSEMVNTDDGVEVERMLISGNRLYVAMDEYYNTPADCYYYGAKLRAFDISSPAAPTVAQDLALTNACVDGNNNAAIFYMAQYGAYLIAQSSTSISSFRTSGTVAPASSFGDLQSETQHVTQDFDAGGTIYAGTSIKAGPGGVNSQGLIGGPILQGNAYTTGSNCSDSAGAAACGSAAAGAVVIDAAATTTVVSTTAVTANSEISLTFDPSLATRLSVTCNTVNSLPYVSARTAGTSFTIKTDVAPVTDPACISFLIVN